MRRGWWLGGMALALCGMAGQAGAQDGRGGGSDRAHDGGGDRGHDGAHDRARPYADPSDVISANIAFLRLARDRGLAAAVKATAADGARVSLYGSAPQPETVADFLAHEAQAHGAPQWPVQQVWMSCDGAIGVSAGALAGHTTSITVWQRQKQGGYKWVAHLDGLVSGLQPPAPADNVGDAEMIGASVADCPARGHHGAAGPPVAVAAPGAVVPEPVVPEPVVPGDLGGGVPDGTLAWGFSVEHQAFGLRLKRDGAMRTVLGAVRMSVMPVPGAVMPVPGAGG